MSDTVKQPETLDDVKKLLWEQYGGENKRITDGNYDEALAVKCINGTFVGRKTDNIIMYRGIPFVGKQPVGDLRWKAPVDAVPDDGVYEAYYNAKSAYGNGQLETGSLYYMDENCLYLNVWKSDETSAVKKPVMVWIHGGAFEAGGTVDPMFDCHSFVKENPDVIVVTIAYRLGVLGFLHLSHLPDGKDYPDSQNIGLLDQIMALKWVHENIAGFGGDPDNVTIFGESAGAASCTLHAASGLPCVFQACHCRKRFGQSDEIYGGSHRVYGQTDGSTRLQDGCRAFEGRCRKASGDSFLAALFGTVSGKRREISADGYLCGLRKRRGEGYRVSCGLQQG